MFTVLFSDTSYNRLGVRLFLYPPHGEWSQGDDRRNRKSEKERRPELVAAGLILIIESAIRKKPENLGEVNAFDLVFWKKLLIEVKQEADELLTGLKTLSSPNYPRESAIELLQKAEALRNCLAQISPEDVQNILNSRTDLKPIVLNELRILPSLIKELPGKLGEVIELLSSKLQ